ncbi:Calmin, partial [Camelus dromedarius]
VERETVQKRTFTRWINLHLEKCNPPLEVKDLFIDIQDGKILMALLEVLSGRNLVRMSQKDVASLQVKLVSIDAAEIADGNPSLVLGLIWNIILFFQIKELTGNLSRNSPSSSLSPGSGGTDSDSSFPPTPTAERSVAISVKDQRKAIRTLLAWVQRKTRKEFSDHNIMVDTPDEQSIVTYVAQFLEHFPELEAEDFVDSEQEAPIESTFVRIKETPSEQESTIFLLPENGERAYTVNHETSHPPPSKVFVCDKPESVKEHCLGGVSSQELSDSSTEIMQQIIDQVLQGVPGKTNDTSEPPPETSILSSRKDNRRSNSLPIKKTVHFEADIYKDASCSEDPSYRQDFRFEGSPRGTKELSKQDGHVSAVEVAEETPKQEAPKVLEAASNKAPGDVSLVDAKVNHSQAFQTSPSWDGASERAGSPEEESRPLSPLEDNTVMAESLEIKVKLLTVEAMDKEDYFEGIPLKASKFNSNLTDFASTSQAFNEVPLPHENKPAEDGVLEDHLEKLGKRRGKSAHKKMDSEEPPVMPNQHAPPKDPGAEDQGCSSAPEEAAVDKKPEVYEKAKRKSPHRHQGEEEGDPNNAQGLGGELPSSPPSSNVSLETLQSPSEEGLDFRPSPPLSKISVIPHDLFYYPHYEVPLAAVLEAYAEGSEDLKNEDMDLEESEGYLPDLGSREEGADEAEGSQSSCSFLGLREDLSWASITEDARPASEPAPPAPRGDHQQSEAEESAPGESHQSQEFPKSENLANPLEAKVMEESISSKKKEKRKHVDHVESSIFIAPGTVQSSDDLEEDTGDHKVPSRWQLQDGDSEELLVAPIQNMCLFFRTSHSDSSIYIRRHTDRSLESDHFSYVQLRNAADLDDRRNRMLTRKANNSGEARLQESRSPRSDSLTQFIQQPDTMYFVLFLWLLVYCLLLFPQLDVNRL